MHRFAYARPGTLAEASALLDDHRAAAGILAGGTDLLVEVRNGTAAPQVILDIKGVVELEPVIGVNGERLTIGATATMTAVEHDQRVRAFFPALAEAAATVGSVQIRNRATLVGNICHASPAADTAPALLVYGAEVNIASARGTRRVPLSEFFLGPGVTALQPGELVTSVDLPIPLPGLVSGFTKVTRRRGVDLATVNMACLVDARGRTRVACGAVGPRPFLVSDNGGTLGDPTTAAAAKAAVLRELLTEASPIDDLRASREYRQAMIEVVGMRLLQACARRRANGTAPWGVRR